MQILSNLRYRLTLDIIDIALIFPLGIGTVPLVFAPGWSIRMGSLWGNGMHPEMPADYTRPISVR